jgi:Cu(I)/Ag(I) efflux system membrane protein CusA/SilA
MPIKARIDMLTTGVRTPLGIKILGSDLATIQEIGISVEMALKGIPGTTSVFAERTTGEYFLDFDLKRDQLEKVGIFVRQRWRKRDYEVSSGGRRPTNSL